MKKLSPLSLALALPLTLLTPGGCGTEQGTTPGASAPSSSSASPRAGHAPSGATPGSHEDWCEEHQVPESLCSRCRPALIPAFKATGDWCDEHGLPESQCRLCNPGLTIERPVAKRGG